MRSWAAAPSKNTSSKMTRAPALAMAATPAIQAPCDLGLPGTGSAVEHNDLDHPVKYAGIGAPLASHHPRPQ